MKKNQIDAEKVRVEPVRAWATILKSSHQIELTHLSYDKPCYVPSDRMECIEVIITPVSQIPDKSDDKEVEKRLTKYQLCGCIVCTCEDNEENRCMGCGSKHCGKHPLGEIPDPVYYKEAPESELHNLKANYVLQEPVRDEEFKKLHIQDDPNNPFYTEKDLIKDLKRDVRSLESALAQLHDDYNFLAKENDKLHKDLTSSKERIAYLEAENGRYREDLKLARNYITRLTLSGGEYCDCRTNSKDKRGFK